MSTNLPLAQHQNGQTAAEISTDWKPVTNSVPCVFLLDDNGEADTTYRFCGTWCREQFEIITGDSYTKGNEDVIDIPIGERCHHCGQPLID